MTRKVTPPICPTCNAPARLTTGREIYQHRADLHAKYMWLCDGCGAYVGTHGDTTKPLGTPAGPELRDARIKLHNRMIDPIWKTAIESGLYVPEDNKAAAIITNTARARVYAYLAHRMGLTRDACHVSMFTIEQCRAAWRALQGVTYPEIRDWYKARKAAAEAAKQQEAA